MSVVRPSDGALAECEDAFAASAGLFAAACAELAAPEAAVMTHARLEDLLGARMREVTRQFASALLRGGDVDQGVYVSCQFASAAQAKPNTMGKERVATIAASLPDSEQDIAVHLRQFAS